MYYLLLNEFGNRTCIYVSSHYPANDPLVIPCSGDIFIPDDLVPVGQINVICSNVPLSPQITVDVYSSRQAFEVISKGLFTTKNIL